MTAANKLLVTLPQNLATEVGCVWRWQQIGRLTTLMDHATPIGTTSYSFMCKLSLNAAASCGELLRTSELASWVCLP